MRSRINSVRNNLRNLFWKYLDELQLLDGDNYVQGNYSSERDEISNDISNAVNTLDNVIEQIHKAPLFLDHMLDFQWLLNCQVNRIDHRNRGVLKISKTLVFLADTNMVDINTFCPGKQNTYNLKNL